MFVFKFLKWYYFSQYHSVLFNDYTNWPDKQIVDAIITSKFPSVDFLIFLSFVSNSYNYSLNFDRFTLSW